MRARLGLWRPLGRLGRPAGGVWGVFGDFGVVFGRFAAVFGGFGTSWGDFGPILSLLATPREANVLVPDSVRGAPELCFLQISGRFSAMCFPRPAPSKPGSGGTRESIFGQFSTSSKSRAKRAKMTRWGIPEMRDRPATALRTPRDGGGTWR